MRKTILTIFLGFIIIALFQIGASVNEALCEAMHKIGTPEYDECLAERKQNKIINHGDD